MLDILNEVRAQIAADNQVLAAARARRDLVAQTATALPGALRRFNSGSVAHGTVNDPVTDADGGIVLDRRTFPTLGPDGDGEGPADVVHELCELVGERVREEYPNARVETSKRGLKVIFNAPINGQDPTVDLIVTLTRKDGAGLWIPNLKTDTWDASDPEEHTKLFTSGTRTRRALRARIVRLAKCWNGQWKINPAFSSFNLQALAWEYVDDEDASLEEALTGFLAYARDSVEAGDTEDPAGISEPTRLLQPRVTAVKRLSAAAIALERALASDDEDIVRDALASVFRDYVEAPANSKSALAHTLLTGNVGVGVTKTGIGVGVGMGVKTTRSFGEGHV